MAVPGDRRYSSDHHWVLADGDAFKVGLTDFAQDALGEVTLVQLLERDTGESATIAAGGEMGEVEAFKAMSDLYMPVEAQVVEFNEALRDTPSVVNTDPYGAGWICRVAPARLSDIDELLDAAAYGRLIGAVDA